MRASRRSVAMAAFLFTAAAAFLAPEERPAVTGTATLSALNRYIFRGYRFGAGEFVLQPYLTATYAGFSASLWGNFDAKEMATPNFAPDREGRSSYNETDISAYYELDAGLLSFSLGFVYYGTSYAAKTTEIFVSASWDVFGKPTLAVFQDVDAYEGTYLNLSWSPSFSIAPGVSLDWGVSAGYYRGGAGYWRTFDPATGRYTGAPYRAFHDGLLKAGLTIDLGPGWKLQPQAQYTFPLSSSAKRAADSAGGNVNGPLAPVVVVGAALQYVF